MPPSQIGYYQLDRLLGEGGMGAVYEAVHRMSGRRVALKTLRAELADRADLQARFFNEARVTSFLEHPGIVRIFDVGRADDGSAYMVMELCRGVTLGEAFRHEPRVPVRLALLGVIADALAHAHDKGVIHRDLKPDNVLVVAGPDGPLPKVLDFGIAKILEGAVLGASAFSVKTRTGSAMGTPLYMSPEQCRGVGGITPASDVYSLGVMLFECVTGRVPFDGGVGEVILQHLTTMPPRLAGSTLVDVHAGLDPLVAAMLEKDAAIRPSMKDVVAELAPYAPERAKLVLPVPRERALPALVPETVAAEAQPLSAPPAPPIALTAAPPRRGLPIPLFLGGVVAVLALGWALAKHQPSPAKPVLATSSPPAPPASPPAPPATTWTIESTPPGADVFAADGHLLGRTPFEAGPLVDRGERMIFVRLVGYRDELLRYDGEQSTTMVRMRARAGNRPRPSPARPNHDDDFEVQPLR